MPRFLATLKRALDRSPGTPADLHRERCGADVPAAIRQLEMDTIDTTVAVAAALLGLPIGIIGGRYAWRRFVEQLGVAAPPHVPLVATLVLVPLGAIIVANAAAVLPARRAVSRYPSEALRDQ